MSYAGGGGSFSSDTCLQHSTQLDAKSGLFAYGYGRDAKLFLSFGSMESGGLFESLSRTVEKFLCYPPVVVDVFRYFSTCPDK